VCKVWEVEQLFMRTWTKHMKSPS